MKSYLSEHLSIEAMVAGWHHRDRLFQHSEYGLLRCNGVVDDDGDIIYLDVSFQRYWGWHKLFIQHYPGRGVNFVPLAEKAFDKAARLLRWKEKLDGH